MYVDAFILISDALNINIFIMFLACILTAHVVFAFPYEKKYYLETDKIQYGTMEKYFVFILNNR